jgi:signal transduction histidine kinase
MKAAKATEKERSTEAFAEEYRIALERYISFRDESALGNGYQLGRKALEAGKPLMEITAIHHQALSEIVFKTTRADEALKQLIQDSSDFLTESLSPYEMAHRGFQDAVAALRQMNDRLEDQIKGIAYAVHDEAGQLLAVVHLALATLATELPTSQQKKIVEIEGLLNEVEKQLRQYSHELRPTVLDDLGWLPALRFLADSVSKRANIPVRLEANVSGRLPSLAETAIYRVVQEALNNAIKHSGASTISISAQKEGSTLFCSIRDNGAGFDVEAVRTRRVRSGLGLTSMQERLNAVGGTLHIESAPGKGTEVQIRLPFGEV